MLRNTPGLIGKAASENLESPVDALNLFIDDAMLGHIVDCTNQKIEADIVDKVTANKNLFKTSYFYEIDLIEMKAFIGSLLYRGLEGQSILNVDYLFKDILEILFLEQICPPKGLSALKYFLSSLTIVISVVV